MHNKRVLVAMSGGVDSMVLLHVLENLIQMITVRIRNKNLPEAILADQFDDLLHTASVQLIENIIQQQDRCSPSPFI